MQDWCQLLFLFSDVFSTFASPAGGRPDRGRLLRKRLSLGWPLLYNLRTRGVDWEKEAVFPEPAMIVLLTDFGQSEYVGVMKAGESRYRDR